MFIDDFWVLIKYQIIFSINRISNMNSIRSNKQTFRVSCEDFTSAMDQKNSMISTLQNEVNSLRANQQRFDKVKQQLLKSKGKYQALMRDYETKVGNNEQVLQLSARNVYQLRMHLDSITEELCLKANSLKQAKFTTQQLMDFQNKKEEEGNETLYKIQQQKNIKDMRLMEGERTRLHIAQVKEEVIKGKREISMIRSQTQSISQKCYKTQNYLRSLIREETNLNESLSKVEDENTYIDASIADLDTIISINQTTISNKEKDCREMEFQIASKELERKKVQNEIRQKVKQLSSQKEKWRNLCQQWQQAKKESNRVDSLISQTSQEINFILSKNGQIRDVNHQLKQDLTVSGRHFDNLARINKCLQQEIKEMHSTNLKAISKLRQPFSNRLNGQSPKRDAFWQKQDHYSKYQTGDFQNCSWK